MFADLCLLPYESKKLHNLPSTPRSKSSSLLGFLRRGPEGGTGHSMMRGDYDNLHQQVQKLLCVRTSISGFLPQSKDMHVRVHGDSKRMQNNTEYECLVTA